VGLICVDGTPGLKVDGVVGPATAAALRLQVTLPMSV
jgi:murein L,D-transpeptidase YcbB/YkuD